MIVYNLVKFQLYIIVCQSCCRCTASPFVPSPCPHFPLVTINQFSVHMFKFLIWVESYRDCPSLWCWYLNFLMPNSTKVEDHSKDLSPWWGPRGRKCRVIYCAWDTTLAAWAGPHTELPIISEGGPPLQRRAKRMRSRAPRVSVYTWWNTTQP